MPLRKMCGEVGSADAFSDKMIGLYGKELLIRLYRAGADGRSGDDFAQEIPDKSILVYRIVRYMDDHLLSMTSVSELAGAFNFSYQHLSAVFSSVMGCHDTRLLSYAEDEVRLPHADRDRAHRHADQRAAQLCFHTHLFPPVSPHVRRLPARIPAQIRRRG